MSKESYIPKLSEEELQKRYQLIKPVIRFSGTLYYIEDVHLSNVSYIWSPVKKERASGLMSIAKVTTYHTYGYYGLFKPSIAEVLAQIPEEMVDQVCAFEIVERPESAEDFGKDIVAIKAGYHVALAQLYKKERNES
ncbi:MAG: hypothetical protein KBC21_00965 [Candidatus Pacebacteria bacterium]|nr:hypothetical protein [Candidatus Paceibacterota bacterium]